MVGLGLTFKYSGLDRDRKIWQSAHLGLIVSFIVSLKIFRALKSAKLICDVTFLSG